MSEADSYCEKCNTSYPYIGILGGGPCKCGGFCIPSSPNTRIIADLRAKLQAAEAASEETLAIFEDQRKRFGKCREDLKTAEAEVAELREELKNWTENGFQYDWEQECIRLQAEANALSDTADRMEQERDKARAEVARLREREGALESQLDYLNEEFGAVATERDRLQTEVARLTKVEASLRASHKYLTRRGKALEGAYNCAQRTLRQLSGDASARDRTRAIAQDGMDEAENLRIQLERP